MTTQNELKVNTREEIEAQAEPEVLSEGPTFKPRVDLYETAEKLTLVADVPGVKTEHVDIDVRDNVLTVTARTRALEARWRAVHEEWRPGHFTRQLRLGQQIDQARISATLRDGVLTVELPKIERAQPRRIAVS
jgi:HSP20 family protein